MTGNKKLFLSAVSSEFERYRRLLTQDLKRPTLDVAVQEDFAVSGGTTLENLDEYIQHCDAVIHLIGKALGAVPPEPAVAALLGRHPDFATRLPPLAPSLSRLQPGFSYTQWEAYLALYHDRPLYVYRPTDLELEELRVPRAERFKLDAAEAKAQQDHYRRITALGHDRGQFLNEERLSSAVLRDLVEILPRLEARLDVPPTRLRHTAEQLIGREDELARLDAAWANPHRHVVVVRAFGGMGKTSLIACWMAELAAKDWRGAERVFDWSFYSQGTREQSGASSDTFIQAALESFGDPDPKRGSAEERGARLAHLVGEVRALLVLDGLEPLQHPPGPMEGKLRDPAVEALLKGLAAKNNGLCVVTTREKVTDIQQHYGRTADDFALSSLSDLAGAALLHHAGAVRAGAKGLQANAPELQAASREVRGHGLTLLLLGQYLRLVEGGDVLRRGVVRLAEAEKEYSNDASRPYGHAFKAMEAYERWFESEGEVGRRQLAVLKLLGLFDRPAGKGCIDALRAAPAIQGVTDPLVSLTERDWKLALGRLKEINLITEEADGSLDAHPLLREYFASQLRGKNLDAWLAAHRRLYEHLCATTKEGNQPTLEQLQPLYQAVAHGCQASLQQRACDDVYIGRILRGTGSSGNYSTFKLGAIGSDLGAIACFFDEPWQRVSTALPEAYQAWLLSEAAFSLRALGRLMEALEPMRVSGEMLLKAKGWKGAAAVYSNLSELELTLGEVAGAVVDAEQSVTYADRSEDAAQRMSKRTTHADALHQAGRRAEAAPLFREGEQIQKEAQPEYPLLYSVQGFQYCDLLLAGAERAAWQACLSINSQASASSSAVSDLRSLSKRAAQTLRWAQQHLSLLANALDHLTLGRAALYEAILAASVFEPQRSGLEHIKTAVAGLRSAGQQDHLPRGLLTRAWLRCLTGKRLGPDSAQADLEEAWGIAERGPMKLFLADIHLYRARLFFREATYPWESPQADLAAAEKIIRHETKATRPDGTVIRARYARLDEQLADAKRALLGD